MEILGIEKVSLVDYEGKICATIFTGGCNYKCPFCHNSGIVNKEYIKHDEDEILNYLKERKKLLDAITISGGEPTLQPDLEQFIATIKEMGYLVKLDTNGTLPTVLENLFQKKLIDYVAMDIKNNFEDYSIITNTQNTLVENVKQSLKLLKKHKVSYELRTTLVEEFHSEESIKKMANDLKGEKLLYLQKFVDKETCFAKNLSPIKKDKAEKYKQILSNTLQNVELRGY